MRVKLSLVCICLTVILFALGCSGGKNPVEPVNPGLSDSIASLPELRGSQASRSLLGYWLVRISEDLQTVEIIPQRATGMHLNAVGMLENLCDDCLVIHEVEFLPDNRISAMMIIRHPFPGIPSVTIFDVRGTIITGKGYDFPHSGKSIAWGDNVTRMLNYDGYTSLFNPTEFPPTHPPAFGYIPGHRATGGDLSATLNPYMAFEQDKERCMFETTAMAWNYMQLYVPSHPIEYGYAVDVCWQLVEEPVNNPVEDFPLDANSLEAYRVDVQVGDGIESGGGSAQVHVKVFDHQGLGTIESVTVEAPDFFTGDVTLGYSMSDPGEDPDDPHDDWHLYTGTISNDYGAGFGEYPVLIRVVDTEIDQNLGPIDAWQVHVPQIKRGWVRTWGGKIGDIGYDVAINSSDTIYVTGTYADVVDFDPGLGVDAHGSHLNIKGEPTADVFLSSFDASGIFQWVRVWGGSEGESGFDIAIDDAENLYVTGYFMSSVDFDPGGSDVHSSNGMGDVFLSKFDSSGNFLWAQTWGGPAVDAGYQVAVDDSGGVYVTGFFQMSADFDPGAGLDSHDSNGSMDVYLVKFDTSGAFQWARTWGGDGSDSGQSVTADSSGQVYVSGYFQETVDFDPGPDTDIHTVNDGADAFLSVFDSSGSFLRAYTWGGEKGDYGDEVTVDEADNAYVVGTFSWWLDLDPTDGIDIHISEGAGDGFIIKFDSAGNFQWAKSWGGVLTDYPLGIALDGFNNAFVTGKFRETSNFDPGGGTDNHTSYGLNDVFLSKFDTSGNFQWARTWGGPEHDYGNGLDTDSLGNAFVIGYFSDIVDFDTTTSGFDLRTSNGLSDAFLCKYPPDGNW